VLSVARRVTGELAAAGAEAVALVGSHARGDARPESDVDLLAVGEDYYLPRLQLRDGVLVSVSMQPLAAHRESFELPELVCVSVPGWRDAVVLHDPEELAAFLVREARGWTWVPLERRCDEWVAEKITGYAEEVHKLVAALEGGQLSTAAVQRSLLAVYLAPVLAVHHRILYGSENRLWELVSDAMGEEWSEAQSTSLGQGDKTFTETCAAALRMYGLAAAETAHLLDERQRRVVRHACALSGQSASL
jgi:predicted nucleotidyltransferase